MNHSFDVQIAMDFDVETAIFLNSMAFWITRSVANRKHFHENTYWIYNSRESFTELFPYWSTDQIKRLVSKCVKNGLILRGNFNKLKCDKTNWYALTHKALCYFPILNNAIAQAGLDWAKSPNGVGEIAQPIPDINSVKKDLKDLNNTTTSDLEILEAYHETLPDSPKIKVVDPKLHSQIRKMVTNWKTYSSSGKSFSIEAFKSFLCFIKTQQPRFLLPYATENGNTKQNNLRTITRETNLAKLVNDEFNFK